jgi:hypothetical protein
VYFVGKNAVSWGLLPGADIKAECPGEDEELGEETRAFSEEVVMVVSR